MNNKNLIVTLEALSNSVKETVDTVLKATKESANNVVKKSENIVEISKLNALVSSKNNELSSTLEKIGEVVTLKFESNIYIDPDLVEYASQVADLRNELAEINQQILKLKNKKQCSQCGEYLDNTHVFCPNCGAKQEVYEAPTETCTEDPKCEEKESEECPTCLEENNADNKSEDK